MVRSSYKAGELFIAAMMDQDRQEEAERQAEHQAEHHEHDAEASQETRIKMARDVKAHHIKARKQPNWNPSLAAGMPGRGARRS